jgi:hypothetical protein
MAPHSLFRRFVSLLLAVLVLTATVGLTVQRHTCRISGRTKVSVAVPGQAAAAGCNMLAPLRPVVKDNCCDFSSHVHKLSAPAHELAGKVLVPVPALTAWVPEALCWPVRAAGELPEAAAPRWFAADSSPPPRSGRALLVFVCTLVV